MILAEDRAARAAAGTIWRQIERDLAARIDRGELKRGARLPSALQLARDLRVNRHTVRRALASLEERGLVRSELGRGTFVCEESYDYPIGKRTRFTANMRQLNVASDNHILETSLILPPPRVAEVLGLTRGERVWRIETTATADDTTLDHCEAFFPAARFPQLDLVFRRTRTVTGTLAEFGVTDYTRRFTKVSAVLPGKTTARVLAQPATKPVLLVESLNVDASGLPVQYALTRFAGARVQLVLRTDS
jgi:GntR family phosphonate transport system transcriptional regulator